MTLMILYFFFVHPIDFRHLIRSQSPFFYVVVILILIFQFLEWQRLWLLERCCCCCLTSYYWNCCCCLSLNQSYHLLQLLPQPQLELEALGTFIQAATLGHLL